MPDSTRLRIIVLGYVVRGPLGGLAWHHLQYVLGLARLGHDVYFLEDSGDYPACYDPTRHVVDTNPDYGLKFAAKAFDRLDLGSCWAYHDAHTSQWHGPHGPDIQQLCKHADVVLNVSGVNPMRPWVADIPHRALIDTDPLFTQLSHLTEANARALATQHTVHFTFGQNIGKPGCSIPDDGFAWRPTRQPMVIEAWALTPGPTRGRFTTVMQWDSYAKRTYGDREYGVKSDSFEPYFGLPVRTDAELELALGSESAPRERLASLGWHLRDPLAVTRDPWTYQRYIRESKAEFSVAKQGYVVSRSGWFSERSACYLACGRPVVVQDTGFSEWLKNGDGVVAFKTPEEALSGIKDVNNRYIQHCEAARAVAKEYFDAHCVLTALIEQALS